MANLAAPNRSQAGWRISVDRAWRSASLRRKFEIECGLDPLAENPSDQTRQAFDGFAKTYHDRFLVWATKQLGLEQEAPPAIQSELASAGNFMRDGLATRERH